jgi:glutaconate CoA-transferase subunit A
MTASEAVAAFVHDGDCMALSGFVTNRRPYGLIHETIRQKKKNLYVESGCAGGDLDMLIGTGTVQAVIVSYIANSGYTQVCRRFREAVEQGKILFEDLSLDAQTIGYHGASLGLPYVPIKNMLGSSLQHEWGISEEERKLHPKLPQKKFILEENPFKKGETLCLLPAPHIDVALIHAQQASPDGTCRLNGPVFQDADIGMAAAHTIVSCDELIPDEEIRRNPELNTFPGLCVSAVVPMKYGAHPSQCFGIYDYDSDFFIDYDKASRSQKDFDVFMRENVTGLSREKYLEKWESSIAGLLIPRGEKYVAGIKRK